MFPKIGLKFSWVPRVVLLVAALGYGHPRGPLPAVSPGLSQRIGYDEETLSHAFDRAWASMLLQEAARLQAERARAKGEDAVRRVDLLSLRFEDGLPIREIALRWGVEPDWLHHQYARARDEFKRALKEIVGEHQGVEGPALEEECLRLLQFFQ